MFERLSCRPLAVFLVPAACVVLVGACSASGGPGGSGGSGGSGGQGQPGGYTQVLGEVGQAVLPDLPMGRAANMSLLEQAEIDRVDAADERAPAIRQMKLEIWIDQPNTEVTLTQTKHGFTFGFPIELGRFHEPGDLEWFTERMSEHCSLAVLESDAKWARIEPTPGAREFARADADIAWAEDNGFEVKGHTLLWGIPMPFSSSALPQWAEEQFPSTDLTENEKTELRAIVKAFIQDSVTHYDGKLAYWDVTNESMQGLAQWFITRLGPEIINDAFDWAREVDPEVQLVFNEWIVEVFTGLQTPTAPEVRDRVLQLLDQGVPIDALGQQAHFAPTAAFIDPSVDISGRTKIDDYAAALDALAETGLPIHITETNFIAPDDPELRAAQAEALLRLWWGHPSVEQIVFWGPWNKVAGRDEFDVGFWDDDRNLTRHGEAVFSLLNDRWRTRATVESDGNGKLSVDATYGEYVAEWSVDGQRYHGSFRIDAGSPIAGIALTTPVPSADAKR